MNLEKDEKFLFCMAVLGEAFTQEVSDMKIKVYAMGLEDIPVADIERACKQIIQSRGTATFPKVAEIRQAIQGNPEDRAHVALAKLEDALEHWRGDSVVFDDPVIHMAVKMMGGWMEISDIIDRGDWRFRRGDFVRLYKACMTSPVEYPRVLKGLHQLENEAAGKTPESLKEEGYSQNVIEGIFGFKCAGDRQACLQIAHEKRIQDLRLEK
ncbi:MAG: DUF6475 domain-containing protein [Desulfobacteraceae bacterium]|nr:DUF6475 domain-containing protein [Desulfobacteraceae bacterium]